MTKCVLYFSQKHMGISINLGKKAHTREEHALFPEIPTEHLAGGWLGEEGRLSVDVADRHGELVVRSAIAGVHPEDLEVFVHNDMLTIRGRRLSEEAHEGENYLVKECHWGSFSRTLILPAEIDVDQISATIKDGILTVTLPKLHRDRRIEVTEK